jgi:hypothetical protein
VLNSPLRFLDPFGLCPDPLVDCVTVTADGPFGFDLFSYIFSSDLGAYAYVYKPGFYYGGTWHPPLNAAFLYANKLAGFNACVAQANSVENQQLITTTGEIITGGLVFATVGWLTIESGTSVINDMSSTGSGFIWFSAATSDLPHVGFLATAATGGTALMAHGSVGELKAFNQYDNAVANCQVKYGFPNVP